MILRKDMLTKSLKKGRTTAVDLLNKLAQAGGLPVPHFEYEAAGSVKKRKHFFKVRFRVPEFLVSENDNAGPFLANTIFTGAGKCTTKVFAKSLAALEVVLQLEEALDMKRGELQKHLEDYQLKQKKKQEAIEAVPVEQEIHGVSWENLPLDPSFGETLPATRRGTIDFSHTLLLNSKALQAAKAITLTSKMELSKVEIQANQTDSGAVQRWANISAKGKIQGYKQNAYVPLDLDRRQAEVFALHELYSMLAMRSKEQLLQAVDDDSSSFGTAKLFVKLPKHQFAELKDLLEQVKPQISAILPKNETALYLSSRQNVRATQDEKLILESRIATFRKHQRECPLPVDSIEKSIPHDAPVTIVQGGTGSGKTSRYPLMLALFSGDPSTKVLVAQPRRLACQTAARRVAYEQGFEIGSSSSDCPIGYSIRFESFPSKGSCTVDFQTPGVILRRAMADPLLSDVTVLTIDEVHERNSEIDLLLALAKQALVRRASHATLPPLRVVVMSATLDSKKWETYFQGDHNKQKVAILNVPETRRFPVDIVHMGQKGFPKLRNSYLRRRGSRMEDLDEELCRATAELAWYCWNKEARSNSSILCFLPGLEEIRLVHRLILQESQSNQRLTVRYLHSSLSSNEQAKVFLPGRKIILSTNIAETSVTIPDVKIVIDSGRERQFSLLESSSLSETTTVVGSQLITVDISQASARQRAGRAGRVSAGTCYRLYSHGKFEKEFAQYTKPEMLRTDLSQLVLHSLSVYHPTAGSPLQLLLDAPDPPAEQRLKQTLRALVAQGLVHIDDTQQDPNVTLTPLGEAVGAIPVSPRIGRMLFVGLALRAVEPSIRIAALLSVPKIFSATRSFDEMEDASHCSDIVKHLEQYNEYLGQSKDFQRDNPRKTLFEQVKRVERQIEHHMKEFLKLKTKDLKAHENSDMKAHWNTNSSRVAALIGLICAATPHIAHLTSGKSGFSTRDIIAKARIHPSSVNFMNDQRVHWYVYHELRTTKEPYLHVTTATSPLELALFAEVGSYEGGDSESIYNDVFGKMLSLDHECMFVADQWVPVEVSDPKQREPFRKLRQLVTHDMLQQVALDPKWFLADATCHRIVLFVLSALEQQRLEK